MEGANENRCGWTTNRKEVQEEGKAIKKAARIKVRREGRARVRTRGVKWDCVWEWQFLISGRLMQSGAAELLCVR